MNSPNGAKNLFLLEKAMLVMKAAAQPLRVKIINMLMERDQMSREEIMTALKQQQPELLEKHLEVLITIKFLHANRQSDAVLYTLERSKIGAIQSFMSSMS